MIVKALTYHYMPQTFDFDHYTKLITKYQLPYSFDEQYHF